jgi:hypothetical protein
MRRPRKGAAHLFCSATENRTHFNTTCRWQVAATSSKTGGYLYFLSSLRKKKMQIDSGCRHSKCKSMTVAGVAKAKLYGTGKGYLFLRVIVV